MSYTKNIRFHVLATSDDIEPTGKYLAVKFDCNREEWVVKAIEVTHNKGDFYYHIQNLDDPNDKRMLTKRQILDKINNVTGLNRYTYTQTKTLAEVKEMIVQFALEEVDRCIGRADRYRSYCDMMLDKDEENK